MSTSPHIPLIFSLPQQLKEAKVDFASFVKSLHSPTVAEHNLLAEVLESHQRIASVVSSSGAVYYLVDLSTMQYLYVSDTTFGFTGYSKATFEAEGQKKFYECLHPADANLISARVFPTIMRRFHMLPLDQRMQFAAHYNYRVHHLDGTCYHCVEQAFPVLIDEAGNLQLVSGIVTVLGKRSRFPGIQLTLRLHLGDGGHKVLLSEHYNAVPGLKISQRETDVLRLLAEGCTSAEIGEQLYISRHTVDTHRRNLLRKLNLKSTSELIVYGIEAGWI